MKTETKLNLLIAGLIAWTVIVAIGGGALIVIAVSEAM